MTIIQNYKIQIGMVGGALIGSILGSILAVSFINETPSKGYVHALVIVLSELDKT